MLKEENHKKPDDILLSFHIEINKVKDNERSVVIITHGFIELLITAIATTLCKEGKRINSNSRDYPQSVKLVLLYEMGVLDKELFLILDKFRKIRNSASHEPFFKLNDKDIEFIESSYIRFFPDKIPPNYNINDFCTFLVGTIWNDNLNILGPIFLPQY